MRNALKHRDKKSPVRAEKTFVGKFVCYGEEDGSFSWGRIVDEGVVNSPEGEKEVFILADRTTCRVPKSALEMESVRAVSRAIGPGGQRHFLPSPSKEETAALLPEKCEEAKAAEPQPYRPPERPPELDGIVPDLGDLMGLKREDMGNRTPMKEMVRTIKSRTNPDKEITFLIRKYEYRTNVRKERINILSMQEGGDIVDKDSMGLEGMTDDELFLCVMGRGADGLPINQGMKNLLEASSVMKGESTTIEELPMAVVDMAASTLKNRLEIGKEDKVVDAEVVEDEPEYRPDGFPDLAKIARPFWFRK